MFLKLFIVGMHGQLGHGCMFEVIRYTCPHVTGVSDVKFIAFELL